MNIRKILKIIVTGLFMLDVLTSVAQSPPLSTNWYRIPYADGTKVKIVRDFINHGNNEQDKNASEDQGPMDLRAENEGAKIVAAAEGKVISVFDSNNECGCHSNYFPCANSIKIQHANNEMTLYVHIAFNSATVKVGDSVSRGQIIAKEGDVGWTCGNGRDANTGSCVGVVPAGTGKCGRHLHWAVIKLGPNGSSYYVNPRICTQSVDGSIFKNDATYTAEACLDCKSLDSNLAFLYPISNIMRVYTAGVSIIGRSSIENTASISFQAPTAVYLQYGFHAKQGSYFHGNIGNCSGYMQIPSSVEPQHENISQSSSTINEKKLALNFPESFSIYPNPFGGTLTVELIQDTAQDVELTLSDGSGTVCKRVIRRTESGKQRFDVNVSELPAGLYFYRLQAGATHYEGKIVKQ